MTAIPPKIVKSLEKKLKVSFPEAFHSFLSKEENEKTSLGQEMWYLFSFEEDHEWYVLTQMEALKENALFPSSAIAVGHNGGGDYLVFLRNPNGRALEDALYAWEQDTGSLIRLQPGFGGWNFDLEDESNE